MNPLLLDVPEHLESERLLIRCPRAGDGAVVHRAVVASLAELRAWGASLPWALFEPSVDASESFCRQGQVDYLARKNFQMLLFLKADGAYIGGSGLHDIDWGVPRFEVGYWCHRAYHGQGLITEAVRAITQFAVHSLGAARIECLTDAQNLASRRVCEKAGYQLEGVMRAERKAPDGGLRDTCLYAHVS